MFGSFLCMQSAIAYAPSTQRSMGDTTVVVDATSRTLQLSHRYLDPATLVVTTLNGDTVDNDGLLNLDPTRGRIQWLQTPRDSLHLSYRYLPVVVLDTLQRRSPLRASAVDSLVAGETITTMTARDPFEQSGRYASNLRRSGHILRGVQVGSGRDVSLESGLHLSLDGRLARDIEVRALLDDRTLPIQPEGTSRRLTELDQVYIDVTAGRTRGRFGDYRLDFDAGRYGQIDRRLEGGLLESTQPDWSAKAAGAVTRAVYHSNRFQGSDGIQGPYRLSGRNGERDLIIIGGSETVWVDGIKRQRGELADYTIDYSRGEITFTPHLPISSESRIEVDFEYSPEAFPRNLYAAQAGFSSPDERFRAKVNFAVEGDDPERPIGFDMSPSIRSTLANADPGDGVAYVPSADSLGANQGDYTRVDSTWTDGTTYSVFRFVEPDEEGDPRGEWQVLFSEIGSGQGDYERTYDPLLGNYRFAWVGPGEGSWVAARRLPLPEERRNAAFSFALDPGDWLSLGADIGVSQYDPNTLARSDSERNGLAQNYTASITPWTTEEKRHPLQLDLNLRREQAQYSPFSRTRDAEFDRTWGLDSLTANLEERETGARFMVNPANGIQFDAGYGELERFAPDASTSPLTYASTRLDAGTRINRKKLNLSGRYETIQSDRSSEGSGYSSQWDRAQGAAAYTIGSLFRPSIDGEWEERDLVNRLGDLGTFAGHRYNRWRASWGVLPVQGHDGSLFYQQRNRYRQVDQESYDPLYSEWSTGGQWRWKPLLLPLQTDLELSHSEKSYEVADSSDVTSDLAALRAGWSPLNGALTSDLNYRLSRTVTRPSVLIAYPVPVGQGDYIRVGDEYIYDPEIGDIILRPEPTGDALPTTDLAAAINLDWSPHRLPGGRGQIDGFGWEDISLVTQLEAQEITRWDQSSDIYLLRLSNFQTDSTVSGRLFLRQEVYLFRPSRTFNARIRYEAEERLTNLYLTGPERNGRDAWDLRTRHALGRDVDLENEGRYERRTKDFARRSTIDRFELNRLSSELSWRLSRIWRFSWQTRGLLDRDLGSGTDVRGLGLRPGLTWALRERGRISLDFEALWIEAPVAVIPYDLADGRPVGRNGRGNLRADYRLGGNMTARAVYTVRLDANRDPIHLARVEVNAFF